MPLVFPETGLGSLAPQPRRALALLVDWVLSGGVALLFTSFTSNRYSTAVMAIWLFTGVMAVTFFSFTPGQMAVGLRVVRVDEDAPVGFLRALGRSLLIGLVIPVFFTDKDGRGLQDRVTSTAVVRLR